ncbi:hypothetical protein CVT24_011106, partial [Panaeolus cyanescens]
AFVCLFAGKTTALDGKQVGSKVSHAGWCNKGDTGICSISANFLNPAISIMLMQTTQMENNVESDDTVERSQTASKLSRSRPQPRKQPQKAILHSSLPPQALDSSSHASHSLTPPSSPSQFCRLRCCSSSQPHDQTPDNHPLETKGDDSEDEEEEEEEEDSEDESSDKGGKENGLREHNPNTRDPCSVTPPSTSPVHHSPPQTSPEIMAPLPPLSKGYKQQREWLKDVLNENTTLWKRTSVATTLAAPSPKRSLSKKTKNKIKGTTFTDINMPLNHHLFNTLSKNQLGQANPLSEHCQRGSSGNNGPVINFNIPSEVVQLFCPGSLATAPISVPNAIAPASAEPVPVLLAPAATVLSNFVAITSTPDSLIPANHIPGPDLELSEFCVQYKVTECVQDKLGKIGCLGSHTFQYAM